MTLYNNNPQLRQLVALPQTFTLQMFLDLQPTLLLPAAKQHASNLLHYGLWSQSRESTWQILSLLTSVTDTALNYIRETSLSCTDRNPGLSRNPVKNFPGHVRSPRMFKYKNGIYSPTRCSVWNAEGGKFINTPHSI